MNCNFKTQINTFFLQLFNCNLVILSFLQALQFGIQIIAILGRFNCNCMIKHWRALMVKHQLHVAVAVGGFNAKRIMMLDM